MFSLILGVLPLHNGSLALGERVQSVLSLSHPVWIFLQRLFLSLFPEPPETSGLISPVRAYSGAYYSHACVLSHVQLFVTPWTVAHQGPPSMEFSRPEYWSTGVGSLSLLQGIFPTQGSNPRLLHLLRWHLDSLPLCHVGSTNPPPHQKKEYK